MLILPKATKIAKATLVDIVVGHKAFLYIM